MVRSQTRVNVQIPLSYTRRNVLAFTADRQFDRIARVHLLSRPRRPRRSGEWTSDRAVTFIVTLAATRSVTLAARGAGMSRKSAYALRARDAAFAAAWTAAANAAVTASLHGDKVEEVERVRDAPRHGDTRSSRIERERRFVRLVAALRGSAPLAAGGLPQ
jgi:hypothetical protein